MPADCKHDKVGQLGADKTNSFTQQVSMIDDNEASKWHGMIFLLLIMYIFVYLFNL